MAPFMRQGVYVNYMDDQAERIPNAYGENHLRLQAIKRRFDPGNVFRVNQNIVPTQH